MNFFLSLQVGLREIIAHKFRSFLTMFGIILGVASVVAMFATVEGMTRGFRERLIMSGGVETFNIINQEVPAGQEDIKDLSPGLTLDDVRAIKNECPLIVLISPEAELFKSTVQYTNKTTRPRNVIGVTPQFLDVDNFEIEEGRFLTDLDIENQTQVCVIGWPVWDQLEQSRNESPLGKTISINEVPLKIVGILRDAETAAEKKRRESGKMDAWIKRAEERRTFVNKNKGKTTPKWTQAWYRNNMVLMPISTMQGVFMSANLDLGFGQLGPDSKLNLIAVKAINLELLNDAVDQVKGTLIKAHRGVEDFGFNTKESWGESIESSVTAARVNGGIISGISLLVGGVGITNIMLASISERVREIGIRLAVGARSRAIFFQILTESVILGSLGGLLGLVFSLGVVELIKQIPDMEYEPIIAANSLIISFGFAVLTGVIAGIYPAFKASRLDPIQALRYE